MQEWEEENVEHARKMWFAFGLLLICLMVCVAGAGAAGVDATYNIELEVGEDLYYEVYRDNGYTSTMDGFLAIQDGGSPPIWLYIYNTQGENPRRAWLQGTAQTEGNWSFRVGVFETPTYGKDNIRVATIQINLSVGKRSGGGSNPVQPPPSQNYKEQGYVLCESLSLRSNPNNTAKAISSIPYGTILDVRQVEDQWCKVNYQGTSGWVDARYVILNPRFLTTQNETAAYAYPASNAPRVGLIDPNTRLAILFEYDDYYVVSLRAASAFIHK